MRRRENSRNRRQLAIENDKQCDERRSRRRSRQLNETPQQRQEYYQRQTNYTNLIQASIIANIIMQANQLRIM